MVMGDIIVVVVVVVVVVAVGRFSLRWRSGWCLDEGYRLV
jgi:hypothetical protein